MGTKGLKLTCAIVNSWDMIIYLSFIGHEPQKIRGNNYWYHSPLRNERVASFKVNRVLNRWFDFGLWKGGTLVDFAILYYNCTIVELLQQFSSENYSLGEPSISSAPTANRAAVETVVIRTAKTLQSSALIQYLGSRGIPEVIAKTYCQEVAFSIGVKQYYAIGFKNDLGGYELRNAFFKGSSAPKGITHIKNGARNLSVFEGFIDFLSFLVVAQNSDENGADFLILNTTAFFEKALHLMLSNYDEIYLYLDNDTTGQNCSSHALAASAKCKDKRNLYQSYKDINEWLVQTNKAQDTTMNG